MFKDPTQGTDAETQDVHSVQPKSSVTEMSDEESTVEMSPEQYEAYLLENIAAYTREFEAFIKQRAAYAMQLAEFADASSSEDTTQVQLSPRKQKLKQQRRKYKEQLKENPSWKEKRRQYQREYRERLRSRGTTQKFNY